MVEKRSFADKTTLRQGSSKLPWLGWMILALTAIMSETWSSHKLLEQDEIFSLQTDRVSSLPEVLKIQRSYPISLEPPPYHVMAHAAITVFGPTSFALRLPALGGYLLMQFCLYFFVRNLVGQGYLARRAGLVAMAFPALTWTLYYSAEGRPYGVLLGSYAATALCWQIASLRGELGQRRVWPLIGLAFALALTLNVHFYGVLLLVPLCGAEVVRTFIRRRVDWGITTAISAGILSLSAALPYVKSSSEFSKHYYAGPISAHMLTQPYRQMLMDYTMFPKMTQTFLALLLLLAAAVMFGACVHIAKRKKTAASKAEWTMVVLLALLPAFAFLLGKTVTHALEVRHSIGAIVGISSLIAIALLSTLKQKLTFFLLMTLLIIGLITINYEHIRASASTQRKTLTELKIPPKLKAAMEGQEDPNIYFQDLGKWEVASLYEPDDELRSKLVLVYSLREEMEHEKHDTMYLTAIHTKKFCTQKIVSYDELRKKSGTHVFVVYPASGWDWILSALSSEAAEADTIGQGFGGNVINIRFKQE